MKLLKPDFLRRSLVRETGIFTAFCALTAVMTWPLAYYWRDGVTDVGDPYLNAWILWWDFHQTWHDPLHLFQAPIFYPYQYTLAFSEHFYGLALLFFPFFAAGLQPLTVQAIATLAGFAFSGYGMFRLTRTLTNSALAAWVAGLAFAFAPYRFNQMPHLGYIFAAWIPLTLEALVLFARERTWKRAVWLGTAFLMNALTCVHWFVLTLIPLATSAVILITRHRLWREYHFWLRGGITLGAASLVLLPFLLPYQRVSTMYRMERASGEAVTFSAEPSDWLKADERNKLWNGLGISGEPPAERTLFPGLVTPLLALAAIICMIRRRRQSSRTPEKTIPPWFYGLDLLALTFLLLAILSVVFDTFRLTLFGITFLRVSQPLRPLLFLAATLFLYDFLAYGYRSRSWVNYWKLSAQEGLGHGVAWLLLGFAGSLGMNFFFHRFLFDYVFIFRSIRVPTRWTMLAILGLALLAGLGADRLVTAVVRWQPRLPMRVVGAALCALMLFEMRAAPLNIKHGQADPDEVTLFLKETPMSGGVAHLPVVQDMSPQRYTLRQADHQKPLITAFSGFVPPLVVQINDLLLQTPVTEQLLDVLEDIPTSYLVVHWYDLPPLRRDALQPVIDRALASGRLRLVRTFPVAVSKEEIYVFTKNEPDLK